MRKEEFGANKEVIIIIAYILVVILGYTYTPWATEQYADFEKAMALNPVYRILFAGISDLIGFGSYLFRHEISENFDDSFGFFIFYSCVACVVFALQRRVVDGFFRRVYDIGLIKKLVFEGMIGNIILAVSAYLLYFFEYPLFGFYLMFFNGFIFKMPYIFVGILVLVVGIICFALFLPVYFYTATHFSLAYYGALLIPAFVITRLNYPLFVLNIITIVLSLILAFICGFLSNKVFMMAAHVGSLTIEQFLPFLSGLFKALYNIDDYY